MTENISKAEAARRELYILETCLTILVTLDGVTLQYIQEFHDMVSASRTDEGRYKYGIVQPFAKDGKMRSMNNRLAKLIRNFDNDLASICSRRNQNADEFMEKMADSMDATEEVLRAPIDAYSRLLELRLSSTDGQVTPLDPKMLSALLRCIIFCDLSANVYSHISSDSNFPMIAKAGIYKFLRLDVFYEQIVKMLTYMDFLDTDGRSLTYDLKGLMFGEESMEISDDIMHILYSSEYIDIMSEAKCGVNPNFSKGEFKSLIPSFEESTLTLVQYREKYENKYLTTNKE